MDIMSVVQLLFAVSVVTGGVLVALALKLRALESRAQGE